MARSNKLPALERETVTVRLPDGSEAALLRVRDPRARRMRLIVGERGVRLTLPRSASLRQAEAFVREHGDWLAAQLRRQADSVEPARAFDRNRVELAPLRGQELPLHWLPGRFARVEISPQGLIAQLPAQGGAAAARRALKEFYLAQARADIGRWLPEYLPGLPAAPSSIRLRALSSLWGSLSAGNALSLDLALVLAPPPAFEYVLVHELCHLIHRNHSPAYWRQVEARLPAWREQRRWFHEHGMALKTRLRHLIGPPPPTE